MTKYKPFIIPPKQEMNSKSLADNSFKPNKVGSIKALKSCKNSFYSYHIMSQVLQHTTFEPSQYSKSFFWLPKRKRHIFKFTLSNYSHTNLEGSWMMVASSTKHKKRWGLPKETQKTTGEHKEKPNLKKN